MSLLQLQALYVDRVDAATSTALFESFDGDVNAVTAHLKTEMGITPMIAHERRTAIYGAAHSRVGATRREITREKMFKINSVHVNRLTFSVKSFNAEEAQALVLGWLRDVAGMPSKSVVTIMGDDEAVLEELAIRLIVEGRYGVESAAEGLTVTVNPRGAESLTM